MITRINRLIFSTNNNFMVKLRLQVDFSNIEEYNPVLIASIIGTIYLMVLLFALRNWKARIPIYRLSIILAILGFIIINFLVQLPSFLIVENIFYAIFFTISLVFSDSKGGKLLSLFLSVFAAGRISRSIIDPSGHLQDYAIRHIPIEIHLLFIGIMSWVLIAATPQTSLEVFEKEFAEPPAES